MGRQPAQHLSPRGPSVDDTPIPSLAPSEKKSFEDPPPHLECVGSAECRSAEDACLLRERRHPQRRHSTGAASVCLTHFSCGGNTPRGRSSLSVSDAKCERASESSPRDCAVISIIIRMVNEAGNRTPNAHLHKAFFKHSGWRSLPARLSPLLRISVFELDTWENALTTFAPNSWSPGISMLR